MTIEKKIANFFKLTDEAWLKHSSPWSVYTRFLSLPFIFAAIWSRFWLGWWSLVPLALAIVFTFVNPHLFPKPKTTKRWVSKSVMGERVYINRDEVPIPARHKYMPNITNAIGIFGLAISIYGLVEYHLVYVVIGYLFTVVGKMWYLDRMVWILEDMMHVEEYKKWIY
jgi:hypothetical protein